jgi:hypothetical protein
MSIKHSWGPTEFDGDYVKKHGVKYVHKPDGNEVYLLEETFDFSVEGDPTEGKPGDFVAFFPKLNRLFTIPVQAKETNYDRAN